MLLLTTQRQKQHISQTDKTEIHYKILASVFNNSYEVAAVFNKSFSIFWRNITAAESTFSDLDSRDPFSSTSEFSGIQANISGKTFSVVKQTLKCKDRQ